MEKELTRPALLDLCTHGTPFKKSFKRSNFDFLNVFFNLPYQAKPIFYMIKNTLVLPIFLHPKNVFVWRYLAYLFPCVMYTITISKYMYAMFVHQTV